MEVHHHTHHPKKISEYFTEFLMLFLAVTLGFLAENLRESYVEKERAHELIFQLKTDIQNNIKLIDSVVLRDQSLVREFDTAVVYLTSNELINGDSLYANMPPNVYRFLSKNDTYDQMKNSGSLRYIKDTVLLNKIIDYSNNVKAAEFRSATQEYEYFSHEFTNTINKFMPPEIASYKHSSFYSRLSVFDTAQIELFNKLIELIKGKSFFVKKENTNAFKNEIVPVILRNTSLIATSIYFKNKTRESAKDLLNYYYENMHD